MVAAGREQQTASSSPDGDPAVAFVLSLTAEEQQEAKTLALRREPDVAALLAKYPPHSPSLAIRIYNLYHPPRSRHEVPQEVNGPGGGTPPERL